MIDRNTSSEAIRIEVAYARPERQQCVSVQVARGSTAGYILQQVLSEGLISLAGAEKELALDQLSIGVYGEKINLQYVLQQDDRLEIYRPLFRDPKERRRQLAQEN